MNEPAYTDTESKRAKRLKKLWLDEGLKPPSHTALLRLIRKHAGIRGVTEEERLATIFALEVPE